LDFLITKTRQDEIEFCSFLRAAALPLPPQAPHGHRCITPMARCLDSIFLQGFHQVTGFEQSQTTDLFGNFLKYLAFEKSSLSH